jgi:hypothetical protein
MAPKLGHGAGETGTAPEDRVSITTMRREAPIIIRTLTARIHSAFSQVLNCLHSLRMAGLLHEFLCSEEQDTPAVDTRMTRATGKGLRTSIEVSWAGERTNVDEVSQSFL